MSLFSKELDALNWKILIELQKNARISYTELGKKIGLTPPAVADRIAKLEEVQIIKGYKAEIDIEKLGYPIRAIMCFTINNGKEKVFTDVLKNTPEVYECSRITGNYCMVIKLAVKHSSELDEIIRRFKEYGNSTTEVVLSTPIENKVFEN
jgi:Lrp/AsnC family leucine-responsive transcriptional regulator